MQVIENVTLPQVFFKHFASKNQLPGFYISGILVKNGLILWKKFEYLCDRWRRGFPFLMLFLQKDVKKNMHRKNLSWGSAGNFRTFLQNCFNGLILSEILYYAFNIKICLEENNLRNLVRVFWRPEHRS